MIHWFYVSRDMMWVVLAVLPMFTFSSMEMRDQDAAAMTFFFGLAAQCFWVYAAVHGGVFK